MSPKTMIDLDGDGIRARPAMRPPAAVVGMRLAEVDTPALLIDLDAFETNLRLMQQAIAGYNVQLRPHAKTHKCPTIALAQIALGAVGVCCQKVSEAEALVDGGVGDVLISNEVVGAAKVARVAALAQRARISICVDDPEQVVVLAAAMAQADPQSGLGDQATTLDVLVEIDVGAKRCGVAPGEPAVRLAQLVSQQPQLRFAGLQAYQGSAQHRRTVDERRAAIAAAAELAGHTRDLLQAAGIECPKITGGGTGTFLLEADSGIYNELQAGSYVFMDADYAANEWAGSGQPAFQQSLFVWTTVMSRTPGVRAVVDAGLKSSSVDSGLPTLADETPAKYVNVSDEHGVIALNGAPDYALGQKLKLIPGHCDPTVNMHDSFVCYRGDRVEAIWPITARGCAW
ncbi:DSD1 family PLP-dependent enzyme [Lacipirellula limnantheis]|nr:DSD1 family PLP-dependent enzyme [Lacipirellula limnantheis]